MADKHWSLNAFETGYSSGNIIGSETDDEICRLEGNKIGGSLQKFFLKGVKPFLIGGSRVLELGPGKGSWTRAILSTLKNGEVHTIDLQDIQTWVQDIIDSFPNQLNIHKVSLEETDYHFLKDDYFDIFFSFGVFCHMNSDDIKLFLRNIKRKLKKESICIVQYSNWKKIIEYCDRNDGYQHNVIPYDMFVSDYPFEVQMMKSKTLLAKFKTVFQKYVLGKYPKPRVPPEEYWWIRNNEKIMGDILKHAGYKIEQIDMGYFKRDSVALFKPIK